MIELIDVWRTYDVGARGVNALAGVSERVERGEYVAIMGPSGSGKSTLLNVIGCLDRPTRGEYRLEGRNVELLSERELALVRRREIGHVFQTYHLLARLDALGNVELPMIFAGVDRDERRERAADALRRVGLADRVHHRPSELSGGERQRVAVARAVVQRPRCLLADEPTGNLDQSAGAQVLDLLEELHAGGLTVLVVTHDALVARRAHRVLVMRDGRIVRRLDASALTSLADALAGVGAGA